FYLQASLAARNSAAYPRHCRRSASRARTFTSRLSDLLSPADAQAGAGVSAVRHGTRTGTSTRTMRGSGSAAGWPAHPASSSPANSTERLQYLAAPTPDTNTLIAPAPDQ